MFIDKFPHLLIQLLCKGSSSGRERLGHRKRLADFIKTTRGTGPVTVTNRRNSRWQRLTMRRMNDCK